jgi:hypothetical protein
MTMNQRKRLLARLIAVHVALFGVAAMGAALAEDADPGSNHADGSPPEAGGGHREGQSSSGAGGATSGTLDAKVEQNAADNVDISGKAGANHGSSKGPSAEGETDNKGARQGSDTTGIKRSGTELGPIDTRITVLGAPRARRVSTPRYLTRSIAHSSANSGDRRILKRGTNVGVVRNAIGQPLQQTSTNVKGTPVEAAEPAGVDGMRKNGSPPGNGPEPGGVDSNRQGFVPLRAGGVTPHDLRINTVINHSIIDGRDMIRPGSGTGGIGGPARTVAGGLSGTTFRTKHP